MKNEEKKHPVDDLFSRNLRDLETRPRPEAWTRLEGRLTHPPRRVVPAWVKYSAAASVLLIAGWWMVRPDAPSAPDLASVPAVKQAPVARVEKPEQKVARAATENTTTSVAETPRLAEQTPGKRVLPAVRPAERMAQQKPAVRPEAPEVRPVVVATEPAARPQEEVAVKPLEPAKSIAPVQQATASLAKASEEKVFVVKVSEPDLRETAVSGADTTEKRPKEKLFARLAKGWKHIQDGEWSEVGLKKKGILARAEDNLFNKR